MGWTAVGGGLGVGIIIGVTGVGGGSLMTPLLISVFKLNPMVAIGTDLWFATITKTSGVIAHHRHGNVDHRVVGLMLAGSVPAAIAMIGLMHATSITKVWTSTVMLSLSFALLLTAVTTVYMHTWTEAVLKLKHWLPERRKPALTVAAGATVGALVSLSSIGAGAIGAVLILFLYPHLETRRVVGTDIAHAVPLTLVAGIGHASLGHVNWSLLAALLLGSIPGVWIGAKLNRHMPDGLVRLLLCASLATAGLKVII